jgi:branched-chain amino acid aminotransferase
VVVTISSCGGRLERLPDLPSLAAASKELPPGAYSTLRTYGGRRLLRLHQHVGRLNESARLQGVAGDLTEAEACGAIARALVEAGHSESRLRLTWSPPRFFASVEPFAPLAAALYRDGVACRILGVQRDNPHAKDTRFIATASAAQASLPPDVHEGLIVAKDGALLEGLSSNFFALLDGGLHTEEERALSGVTRSLVLEVARPWLPIVATGIHRADLPRVGEAFLTSVSRGILPVVRVDDVVIGTGQPGPVTRELMTRFTALETGDVREC